MRRRLQRFLPIVLVALAVQVLAPVAACWAAFNAASDPLRTAEICHSIPDAASGPTDQGGGHSAHDGACLICCALQASGAIDTPPQTALLVPYREITRVVWTIAAAKSSLPRPASCWQARAPPLAI